MQLSTLKVETFSSFFLTPMNPFLRWMEDIIILPVLIKSYAMDTFPNTRARFCAVYIAFKLSTSTKLHHCQIVALRWHVNSPILRVLHNDPLKAIHLFQIKFTSNELFFFLLVKIVTTFALIYLSYVHNILGYQRCNISIKPGSEPS